MRPESPKPIAVPPEVGEILSAVNVRHRLTEDQTGGACYIFESEFGPGSGNKLHVHRNEDELGYVLEGALAIRLDTKDIEVGAGGIAFLPRNIPHAIRNPLSTPSKYLFAAIPGGFIEHWFEAVDAASKEGGLDDTAYRELSRQYGIEWLE